MKRLLLFLLIASGVSFSQTTFTNYSTTFTGTENPISESSVWTNGTAAGANKWGAVRKSGGRAYGVSMPSTFGDPTAIISGSYGSQQAAIVVVSGQTSGVSAEVEVRLRSSISANTNSGYELLCSVNQSDPYMQLVKWLGPNGAEHTGFEYIATYISANVANSGGEAIGCKSGDWFGAEVTGGTTTTTFKIYKNGHLLQMNLNSNGTNTTSIPDNVGGNAFTGGTPGVGFYSSGGTFDGTWGLSYFAAGQRIAITPTGTDITTQHTAASTADTILVPPGTGTWGGLSLTKAVDYLCSGTSKTTITLSTSSTNTITKSSAGNVRFDNCAFTISTGSANNAIKGFTLAGSWKSAKPTIWAGNSFAVTNTGLFLIQVNGHVFSKDTFTAGWDDSLIQFKDPTDAEGSWSAVDSMGTNDTNGEWNTYIEDSTITGGTNQGIDCDDSCRMVFRHNLTTNFDFNSHGLGSSSIGTRHWEMYNNDMRNTCSRGTDCGSGSNQQHMFLLRGGTGVIYSNTTDNLNTGTWGNKAEVFLGQDSNHEAGCPADGSSYPLSHQLGRGYNGSAQFVDPIYVWSNTVNANGSTPRTFDTQVDWFYSCATPISGYLQSGREYVVDSGAKPGYTGYTYPHPLISGAAPAPPSNLRVVSSGRTIGSGHSIN